MICVGLKEDCAHDGGSREKLFLLVQCVCRTCKKAFDN